MKYKDLIKELLPFAEEDISMTTVNEDEYYTLDGNDPEYGNRKFVISEVRFFHSLEDNDDLIVGCSVKYDKESFEDLTEVTIITQ